MVQDEQISVPVHHFLTDLHRGARLLPYDGPMAFRMVLVSECPHSAIGRLRTKRSRRVLPRPDAHDMRMVAEP